MPTVRSAVAEDMGGNQRARPERVSPGAPYRAIAAAAEARTDLRVPE
ncbi:hypothetical protein GCM10027269_72870 [Kribbella endophytica]